MESIIKRLELLEKRNQIWPQQYLNAEDVARIYPFKSASAVRTLASRRKIPFRKVGGRLVFLRSELDDWIKNSPGLTIEEYKKKEKRR
jgi:hypothetical protein